MYSYLFYGFVVVNGKLAHKATLVTHNTQEISRIKGLSIEDWY